MAQSREDRVKQFCSEHGVSDPAVVQAFVDFVDQEVDQASEDARFHQSFVDHTFPG